MGLSFLIVDQKYTYFQSSASDTVRLRTTCIICTETYMVDQRIGDQVIVVGKLRQGQAAFLLQRLFQVGGMVWHFCRWDAYMDPDRVGRFVLRLPLAEMHIRRRGRRTGGESGNYVAWCM